MDAVRELEARLDQYPPDRYPVQNATTSFHLGGLLADIGRTDEAVAALSRAVDLFAQAGLAVERAKALNGLGAALRLSGAEKRAAAAFSEASTAFRSAGLPLDEGAALHNLGLVTREPSSFRRAQAQFAAGGERRAEAAAARELGAVLLERGEAREAEAVLAEAQALAERAGDLAGLGASANVRGLALLALHRDTDAEAAFRDAIGAHARGVRPAEYAMAKANLALAHERAGDARRARLAARQALAVAEAPAPVRAQASAILARVPPGRGDAVAVLLDEHEEARPAVLREELARWSDVADDELTAEVEAWVVTAPPDLAELLLGALLELPPASMERLAAHFVAAADAGFRNATERAAVRFPSPQLLRLEEAFRWS